MKQLLRMTVCGILALLVATSWPFRAQGKGSDDSQKACRNFVREFYDWYVPQAGKKHSGATWDLALERKSHAFSPDLLRN